MQDLDEVRERLAELSPRIGEDVKKATEELVTRYWEALQRLAAT